MIVNQLKTLANQKGVMEWVAAGFPLSVYLTDFSSIPQVPVDWHWHDDFQLCRVSQGRVRFQVVNKTVSLSADQGLFINCRMAHRALPETPDAAYYGVNFHPDLICFGHAGEVFQAALAPLLDQEAFSAFVFDSNSAAGSALLKHFDAILHWSAESGGTMPLLMQSELLRAWDDVLSFVGKRRTVSAAGNARLKTILQMIDERYMEKLSLQDFARSVSLSPGECERFFKKGTGASLFQYLMQVRIGKSKELLRNTDGSVAEIAQASGFSSQSYFTVCFKRLENCTPLQYRKKMEARPKEKSAQTVL